MASIFQRKDIKGNPWYIQYHYRGKRYREKVGSSKEAAQMRLGEIIRKIETGQFSLYSDSPLTLFIKHYRESLQAEPYSEGYRRRLGNIFNNFGKYFKAERIKAVNQVDYPLLDNYVTQRINTDGISGKTANMEIDLLKRLFDFGVKHRYLMENPAKELRRKKVKQSKPRYFSNEEIELLLEKSGHYEPFFMVLLHTGLRASDAGNLRWSDIDLDKGFIRVTTKKTDESVVIPINETLGKYLLDYGTDTPKLFPELDSDEKRQKVRNHIQRVLKNADYPYKRAGCHTFRHTFASHLVINGASIYDVQKLLGHKSIMMTQVYAHLSDNATRRAVDLIDFNPNRVSISEVKPVINQGSAEES